MATQRKTISGIYQIILIGTHRSYIGQSVDIKARWRAHLRTLRRGTHHSPKLQRAWDKYGVNSFRFEILELCDSDLTAREQHYFTILGAKLNCAPAAGSRFGVPQSAETKAGISAALKGHIKSEETRSRLSSSLTGRKLSPEHCQKISDLKSNTSQETRAKMSASRRGRRATPETREKMSRALKGRIFSAEHRAKLSASLKGRIFSPETRAKLGLANNTLGRKHSVQSRENMRLAALKREAQKKADIANGIA